jgi:hypothetical protein
MQTKPSAMYLTMDGTLYVVGITWVHWGTASATGTGTAKANNCTPNCAAGTFHTHPATITASDPRTWRGTLAYTRVSVSVPAIRYSFTFTEGLIPGVAPSVTPLPSQPSSSTSPSTGALLSSTCTLGFVNDNGTFVGNTAANWSADGENTAEEVTLTNAGTVGTTLSDFETETTWHSQVVDTHDIYAVPGLPEFLTPGQAYTTIIEFKSLSGTVAVSESTYLNSTCDVVTWHGG